MNEDRLYNLLKNSPNGFAPSDVEYWLNNVPNIENFEEIEFLYRKISENKNYYKALAALNMQKYLRISEYNKSMSENWSGIEGEYKEERFARLTLYANKSKEFSFAGFPDIKLISLWSCRNLEYVNLSKNSNLTTAYIFNCRMLDKLTVNSKKIKSFTLSKCNKFNDFSIISEMENIVYLDVSENKLLNDASFLKGKERLVHLSFTATPMSNIRQMINKGLVELLADLPSLRSLSIPGTKKERELFREALPHCYD